MPPRRTSRYRRCFGVVDASGRTLLTERDPFRYRELPGTAAHVVVEGDTLWGLAARYFAPLERPAGLWWIIADFQPAPILDPTLALEPGSVVLVPSLAVVTDVILSDRVSR